MLHLHKLHMSASPLRLAVQLDVSLHDWQLLVLPNSTAESHFVFRIFSNSLNLIVKVMILIAPVAPHPLI